MTPDFILPAGVALHMQTAVANGGNSHRSYLRGVHVEPIPDGGAFLVATDGFAMLIHRDPTAHAARAATIQLTETWAVEDCDGCDTPMRNTRGGLLHIAPEIANGPIAAPVYYTRAPADHPPACYVVAELVDAPFVDWRRAPSYADQAVTGLPHRKPGPRFDHIDPATLQRICAHWTRPRDMGRVRIHQQAPGLPWLVTFESCANTLAVLAPHSVRAPDVPPLDAMLTAIGRQDMLQDTGAAA